MHRRFVISLLALAALAVSGLAGCAGDDSNSSGSIGASGGSYSSPDGRVTLEVPPGAVSETVQISAAVLKPEDWPEGLGDSGVVGDVYDMQPDGLVFDKPVTVTHRIDADRAGIDLTHGLPVILLASRDSSGSWEPMANTVVSVEDGDIVVRAEARHFSLHSALGAALGGTVQVSVYPAPVTKNVGESWNSSVEIWASPDFDGTKGSIAVAEVDPVVGDSGVLELEVPLTEPNGILTNAAGEEKTDVFNPETETPQLGVLELGGDTLTIESYLTFTCLKAGSDQFGADVLLLDLSGRRTFKWHAALMTSTAECIGGEPLVTATQGTSGQVSGLATPDEYLKTLQVTFTTGTANLFCGSALLLDTSAGPITVTVDGKSSKIGAGSNAASLPRPPGGNPLEWPVFMGPPDGTDGIYVDCPGKDGDLKIDASKSQIVEALTPAAAAEPKADTSVRLHFTDKTVTLACGTTIIVDTSGGAIAVKNGDAAGTIGTGGASVLGEPVGGRSQGQPVRIVPSGNLAAIMSIPCPGDPELEASSSVLRSK